MSPLLARVLTDENVHPQVIDWLRERGADVITVFDRSLAGRPDTEVLALAFAESRTVITHDRDFGNLAVLHGQPSRSIVYLRPGHIAPSYAISVLNHLNDQMGSLSSENVIVVAKMIDAAVTIRVRLLE